MKRTVTLPNKQQALVFWLKALDMSYTEIARHLGLSVIQVRGLHTQAQKLATTQGLAYRVTPPVEANSVGSGMMRAQELAQSVQTPKKGMELLKEMAREAFCKR
jgi:hypothetical protein